MLLKRIMKKFLQFSVGLFMLTVLACDSGTGNSTSNLRIINNSKQATTSSINVYFEKPDDWNEAWIWFDSESNGSWETTQLRTSPGDMTKYRTVEGKEWFKKEFSSINSVTFLFNCGDWSKKISDSANNQRDFVTTSNIWVRADGSSTDYDPFPAKPQITVTPAGKQFYGNEIVNVNIQIESSSDVTERYCLLSNQRIDLESNNVTIQEINSGMQVGDVKTLKVFATNSDGTTETDEYKFEKIEEPQGITIFFEKPTSWSETWIWFDKDSNNVWETTLLKQAPGDMIKYRTVDGKDWYKKTISDTSSVTFLFNGGNWNQKIDDNGSNYSTTANIWVREDKSYTFTDPIETKPVILVDPTSTKFTEDSFCINVSISSSTTLTESYYTVNGVRNEFNTSGNPLQICFENALVGDVIKLKVYASNEHGLTETDEFIYERIEEEKITIYFEKPTDWNEAWIWFDKDSDNVWETTVLAQAPGDMTLYRTVGGKDWYKKEITQTQSVTFLFNAGNWNQKITNNGNDFVTTKNCWIDSEGLKDYDPVDNQPPSSEITYPADSATVEGTVAVTINANDNVAVTKVELYFDSEKVGECTTSPFIINWNTKLCANKTAELRARAYDAAGNNAYSAALNITVENAVDTEPPSVQVTSPADGAVLTGSVQITANTSDNVGVTKVEYYFDNNKVAESTQAPFSTNWNTTSSRNTTDTLEARAYDAAGNIGYCRSVSVTLDNSNYVEQNTNVILQGFYWYIRNPQSEEEDYSNETEAESDLYDYIAKVKAEDFYNDGFSHIWLPPSGKAFSPNTDYNAGYAVYDHYDLGEFDQMGRVRTKYGTKDKLIAAVNALHTRKIKVVADIVMNQMLGTDNGESINYSRGIEVHEDGSTSDLGSGSIEAYVNFDFSNTVDESPRGTTYSSFEWTKDHFDGMENYSKYYLFSGKELDDVNIFSGDNDIRTDIILGADLDYQNLECQNEMLSWSKWLVETVGIDGFRVDAIRHIDNGFVKRWANEMTTYMNNTGRSDRMLMFGENWDGWKERLTAYQNGNPGGNNSFDQTNPGSYSGIGGSMSLFDVPLHYDFQKIAGESNESLDINQLPDRGLLAANPDKAVTFVDNHDTVPTEMLASYIPLHTKLQAYTYILLNEKGTPCVYYRDMYKGNFVSEYENDNKEYLYNSIKKLIEIRHKNAYGGTYYYRSKSGILGCKRYGDSAHAGSGLVYLIRQNGASNNSLNIPCDGKNYVLAAGSGSRNGNDFYLNDGSNWAVWIVQ